MIFIYLNDKSNYLGGVTGQQKKPIITGIAPSNAVPPQNYMGGGGCPKHC
jgi:hypothetical protein